MVNGFPSTESQNEFKSKKQFKGPSRPLTPPPHRKWGKKGDLKIQIYFTLYDKRGTSSDGPDTLIVVPIPFMILSSSK